MTGNPFATNRAVSRPQLEILERQPAVDSGKPPLLFVHGLGHGAWCWENWLDAAAAAGHPAYAVSLRGHGGSGGSLRGARLGQYVDDVIRAAATLPRRAVLVGHSLGGLVVQKALARYSAYAGVLVAPVPAHPAVASLLAVARRHPLDAARLTFGGSLPLRADYLFTTLDGEEAKRHTDRCGRESALAQYQLLLHRPAAPPRGGAPVLVLATPDDRLVPIRGVRSTATRYGATLREFPGMGHDLMLDVRWEEPLKSMVDWLSTAR
ncbi:alpha/beta hydrolase [Planosporangium mesophilum]|uniref:Alpha/beta hydrolase n=1 Tax=Planosporangium mesophilum TaxID=689768 RepID=A0A8J3TFR7_9ACTN|nr:alpha/beta fold hydrolase [Planosporangium mesophilum]NJC82923.1 alpha/beta hydrolase [Planosporangium mesophilum]GII24701.1 alpha/beta hydrolase [Planosporangium mesophilum]